MTRFFNDHSFWNTPLPASSPTAQANDHFVDLLEQSQESPGFYTNTTAWTIPVYEADADPPRVEVARRMAEHPGEGRFMYHHSRAYLTPDHPGGHAPNFGPTVPMPANAGPDGATDCHITVIDRTAQRAWDLWGAARDEDGNWSCCSGISYALDGTGVFDPNDFAIHNGESIHMYGPCRAAGVPNLAGMITRDDITRGAIRHKLAFATRFAGLLTHTFPAIWTDGGIPGGIPEGITLQLDPGLDLSRLGLSPAAMIIARALQEYGAVLVDVALGSSLYAEGLWGHPDRTWEGVLGSEDMFGIPFHHYRFIEPESVVTKGMIPSIHPIVFQTYHEYMHLHPETESTTGNTWVGWPKRWYADLVDKTKVGSS